MKPLLFRLIALLLFFNGLVLKPLNAQLWVYPGAVSLRGGYGFIIAHKKDMDQLVTGHIPQFEISWRRNYSGSKEWEKHHRYPNTGFALQWVNLNNPKTGHAISLIPYVGFPVLKNRYIDANLRVGTGLGFLTKTFDLTENRKNNVISSRINAAVDFLISSNWKVSRNIWLMTGVSFTHFSNAAFKIPNAGINIASANAGVTVNLGRPVTVDHNRFPVLVKDWQWLVWTGMWLKETNPVNGSKYFAQTLSLNVMRRFSIGGLYGGGIDFMYDRSLQRRDSDLESPLRVALTGAYEIQFGKLSIPLQLGFYVYDPFKKDLFMYSRIGWRYRVGKRLVLNMTLKSHMAVADYAEMGFGYLIR